MKNGGKGNGSLWTLISLVILALFLLFVVYPLGLILCKSIIAPDGSGLSLEYFGKFFSRKYYWSTLVNSFKVTIVSTAVSAAIGLPMAYVLKSVRIRGSRFLNILIVISYLSPPFIGAYAWIQLLGRNGFITRILNQLFHVQLPGIYGFAGIVLVFSLQSFPLIYMYISGALKNLDNSLNEAAESLGCTAVERVVYIILPLVMPTLLASALLVFMRVFSDFGTPMLIGEGYKTFPVLVYSQFMGEVNTDDHFAAALCVIVIGITLLLFFIQRYLGNRYSYSMTALKPMAYVLKSVRIRGSRFLNILIVISYLSPPFIGAYAWIQLLGRNGFITRILNQLFHVQLPGIYGFAGIVLVFSLQSFPLIYMYISGALKNLDNSLNEAAESLGCTAVERVVYIILPLVMPTLLASALLVFMRVFSDFGTPMLIGEGYKTFPVLVYSQFMGEVNTDDHFAAALCVIVIGITLLLFFIQRYLGNRYSYSMTALKPMEAEEAAGIRNVLAHVFVYGICFVAILPQLTVIVTSFMSMGGGTVYTGRFSLENYQNTLLSKDNGAITNTYLFGLCAIVVVVVLGILISYLTVRKPSLLTGILDTLTMFPYIIPGSVLGISFIYTFNKAPLLLSGTALIMIISLSIRRMPYTIRSSTAIIGQISPSVEEAAISLGASEMKSFLQITVPMMLPGVLSGAIMSWITLISELSSSIILYTSRTRTLTVAIYSEVIRSNFGNAAAYSTILTLTSILSLLIFFKATGSQDISI